MSKKSSKKSHRKSSSKAGSRKKNSGKKSAAQTRIEKLEQSEKAEIKQKKEAQVESPQVDTLIATAEKKIHATPAHKNNLQKIKPSTLKAYISLMRLDRPIGILLVLWPTYWSLWLAARGIPSIENLVIFTLGCVLMRSAGCVINDYADRKIDGRVARTKNRPLATGLITSAEALLLFVVLCLLAFTLVLLTNPLTIKLSFGALLLAFIYPFTKRFTHMPQVFLGAAFAWSIPMAFSAEMHEINPNIFLLYVAVVVWAVIYDTFYAMVDRDDDLKIGVKSTAILFGDADRVITGFLQALFIVTLILAGRKFELSWPFYASLAAVAALFIYQQKLIQNRNKELCFKAFLNNNYVGMVVFIGIWISFYVK